MIIKCMQILNENTKEYCVTRSDGYLTIGNCYNVLEICFSEARICYRIIADNAGIYSHPVLARSDNFNIISGNMPLSWKLIKRGGFSATLGPEKWINRTYWQYSFWEDWGNGNPKVGKCFEEELKIIQDTDPEYYHLIEKAKAE